MLTVICLVSWLTLLGLAVPGTALAASCSTNAYAFEGNYKATTNIDGASARIEYVNEALCTGFDPALHASFSSSWVGIEAPSGANSLFQVGYDKCRGSPPGCAQANLSYFFWAEGWEASQTCGPASPPYPHKAPKGNATGGLHLFTVVKSGSNVVLKIDGDVQHTRSWSIVTNCWGSVGDAAWVNEVINFGDQSGGPNSDRQNWEDVQYHKTSWQEHSGTSCNVNGWPHQQCDWDSSPPDKFWTWDTRY